MMMVEIPLRSAEINGDKQTISLPVEDVVAALVKKYVEESMHEKETDRARRVRRAERG